MKNLWHNIIPRHSGQRAVTGEKIFLGVIRPIPFDYFLEGGLIVLAFFMMVAKLNHLIEYLFFTLLIGWVVTGIRGGTFTLIKTPIDLPVFLFLCWILITLSVAHDPAYGLAEWRKTAAKVLMFYFVVNFVRNESQVHRIQVAFIAGVTTLSLIGIIQYGWEGGNILSKHWGADSLASSAQWFSTYLMMSFPFIWLGLQYEQGPWKKLLLRLAACLAPLALFLTHTRGAWVAVVAQGILGIICLSRWQRIVSVTIGLLCITILMGFLYSGVVGEQFSWNSLLSTSSLGTRIDMWSLGMVKILEHPWTGIGYGRDTIGKLHLMTEKGILIDHMHNIFLTTAIGVGLPGFFLFVWIFERLVKQCLTKWPGETTPYLRDLGYAVLLLIGGVMVRNLFDEMFQGTLIYLFWLLVGLYVGVRLHKSSQGKGVGERGIA